MSATPPRFRISLHALLACLVLAALLPMAAVVSWQVREDMRAEQRHTEDELARAAASFAQSVDREIASSAGALQVLSQSELFQQGRIAAMGRLLHGRPRRDWDSIFLLDAQGGVVLDTAARAAPAAVFRDVHQAAMGKLEPVVTALGDSGFALALPVMQQGQARYVLGARLSNALWARLAGYAELPDGGKARLYDRDGRLISQSGNAAPAGTRAQAEAFAAMVRKPSGVQRSSEAGAGEVYAAWARVAPAGWHARVFVPAAPVDAAQRQIAWKALSTSGVALLVGLVLAAAVADRVVRRVRSAGAPPHREDLVAMLTRTLPDPRAARPGVAPPRASRTGPRR